MSRKKDLSGLDAYENLHIHLESTLKSAMFWTKVIVWIETVGKLISNIIGAIIGTAWVSLILAWVWTGDLLYLKIFAGTLSAILIFAFQVHWVISLINYRRRNKLSKFDMTKMDSPNINDINNVAFSESLPVKYKIIDKKDPHYNKQLFLYPIQGRLNPNKTISFFKASQLEQVIVEENEKKV